jgi:DNA-directed RNA polymerase alpha subunit
MSRTFFTNFVKNSNKATHRDEFDIENMDLSIVNGIRRVMHSEIPNLGFLGEGEPTVHIQKNNGPLHNEIMVHRISLIPIHFTEEEVEAFVEDEYEFACDVKNMEPSLMNVTTHHVTGKKNGVPLTNQDLKRLFPVNKVTQQPIVITRLRQGEELAFTAKVIKSIAKQHASFSPISLCAFYYEQDPDKAKEEKNILQKERAYYKNEFGDPTKIHFMVESECNLSTKYLIAKSLDVLREKLNTIHKELDVLQSDKVSIHKHETMDDTYDLMIMNEDDTLGNLMQSNLYNRYIREGVKILDNKYKVTYVGYFAPHPLEPKIVIRMTLKNDSSSPDEKEFTMVMKEACRYVEREVREVYDAWIRFE